MILNDAASWLRKEVACFAVLIHCKGSLLSEWLSRGAAKFLHVLTTVFVFSLEKLMERRSECEDETKIIHLLEERFLAAVPRLPHCLGSHNAHKDSKKYEDKYFR